MPTEDAKAWEERQKRLLEKRANHEQSIKEIDELLAAGPEKRPPAHLRSDFKGSDAEKVTEIRKNGGKVIGG